MSTLKFQKGVTLLEVMLVLAIASSILVLSLKMYNQYQARLYAEQIKYNLDTLFQAMTAYYRANCSNASVFSVPASPALPVSIVVSINSQLAPYLPASWEQKNPLTNGYVLQFNPTIGPAPFVNACVVTTPGTPCVSVATQLPSNQAQVVMWNAQVAIQTASMTQSQTNAYKNLLVADCVSSTQAVTAGTIVTSCVAQQTAQTQIVAAQTKIVADTAALAACTTAACTATANTALTTDQNTVATNQAILAAASSGSYLVWQRLPSATGTQEQSSLVSMMPSLQEFNLQYTHDQMYELNGSYGTPQNYQCGG